MAGSSIPLTWRHPPADVDRGAPLAEAVCLSYHVLFTYGFHALEMLQCLAERRRGGETGVRAVRCVDGAAVWRMARAGAFDRRLFQAALDAREHKQRLRGAIEEAVARPSLMAIEYRDGFKATVLTLNPVLDEWVTAWRRSDRPEVRATVFVTQEFRPLGHFRFLLAGIERMFQTDQPTWPVERTLLTTGILDAALTSRSRGGTRIETPHLAISYRPTFDWHPPPPPVPDRPLPGP